MKKKNALLLTAVASLLVACGSNNNNNNNYSSGNEEDPNRVLEIGDTVKEWTSAKNLNDIPLGVTSGNEGKIAKDFGNEDNESLEYTVKNSSNNYIGSDLLETPFFTEDDAKNGDIISLSFYVPSGSNLASLQLQVLPSSMRNGINGETITINEDKEESWIRTTVSFDTLETLGAIRLAYTTTNKAEPATFYVDDVNIVYGAETVETGYVSNDESLCETYADYFKVGTCMSSSMMSNTTIRKITKDNFNSITAENEGKPEQILDQAACQALVKDDPFAVAITTKPFEKIYSWAEANHVGVRHHTFVWYSQTPAWFFTKDYTQNGAKADRATMLNRMQNFIGNTITALNERWPGVVYAIDVANEAIENHNYRTNNNNWYSTVGNDFVYWAMKFASEYKEDYQELYYNDFSFDYDTKNCEFALNTLLKQAIEEGIVDGVGIQGHLDSNANMENIITDARMIKEKGLKCQITELDITVNSDNDSSRQQQKKAYKDLVIKMLENNEKGITDFNALIVWGIQDTASWKRNQTPLLFDGNYAKKPCYYGVLEAIDEAEIERNSVEE